jgi:hypothetical protein
MTNDGCRDCFPRRFASAPVMESLDGEFECNAQETRGLWIELLPIKILSDWHLAVLHGREGSMPTGDPIEAVGDGSDRALRPDKYASGICEMRSTAVRSYVGGMT